jgi:hypothetical protein
VRKKTEKGGGTSTRHAARMVEGKTRNVYLGSCGKMSRQEALEKARAKKAEDLGLEITRS